MTFSTSKEGFYGSDKEENRFYAIPSGKGKNEKYFVLVNAKTGKTEVWNEEFGQDRFGFSDRDPAQYANRIEPMIPKK